MSLACCWALQLNVRNTDKHAELFIGDTVFTELSFDMSFATKRAISSSQVCFMINGEVCSCYKQPYQNLVVTMTESCYKKYKELHNYGQVAWLSLELHIPIHDHSNFVPNRMVVSSGVPVRMNCNGDYNMQDLVTLLLPLTIDDLSRASVLLNSLRLVPKRTVYELLVFVPEDHLVLMRGALQGMARELDLSFPVNVQSELQLFRSGREHLKQVYPYAIQMAIKLLAAQIIKTPYYVTLDADIVLLRPLEIDRILVSMQHEATHKKAVYHFEERSVHENWWSGSERLLGVNYNTSYAYHKWRNTGTSSSCINGDDNGCTESAPSTERDHWAAADIPLVQRLDQGFGVTPAVLSTYGSLLTVSHLCRQLLLRPHDTNNLGSQRWKTTSDESQPSTADEDEGDVHGEGKEAYFRQQPIDRRQCERLWLDGFGRQYFPRSGRSADGDAAGAPEVMIWSEYTLYRIVLDHLEVRYRI